MPVEEATRAPSAERQRADGFPLQTLLTSHRNQACCRLIIMRGKSRNTSGGFCIMNCEQSQAWSHGKKLQQFKRVSCVCARTHGVDGYSVDASVLRLELLQENPHTVTERLEGKLTALSPGRQTNRDDRKPILVHHRHLCRENKRRV